MGVLIENLVALCVVILVAGAFMSIIYKNFFERSLRIRKLDQLLKTSLQARNTHIKDNPTSASQQN
jgi:hypothetical protein